MDALSRLHFDPLPSPLTTNSHGQPGSGTASSEQLSAENTCLVCYEPLGDIVITLSCTHKFHPTCIQSLSKIPAHKKMCPYCRKSIRETIESPIITPPTLLPIDWDAVKMKGDDLAVYISGPTKYSGCYGKIVNVKSSIKVVRATVMLSEFGWVRMVDKKYIYSYPLGNH